MTRENVAVTQPVRWPGGRSWLERAACTQEDSELFFGGDSESTRTALSCCRTCPVKGDCLDFALANDQRYGIWGGLTEGRRRKLHDQHNEGMAS